MEDAVFGHVDLLPCEEVGPAGALGQVYIPLVRIACRDGCYQDVLAEEEFVVNGVSLFVVGKKF